MKWFKSFFICLKFFSVSFLSKNKKKDIIKNSTRNPFLKLAREPPKGYVVFAAIGSSNLKL